MASRFKAIAWLHLLRLWRYRLSFLNLVLAEGLWVLLLILGVMLFVPPEWRAAAYKEAFWVIVCWSVISQATGLMGGWMSFFISIGMVEEHMLRGVSPFKVIAGRLIPSMAVVAGFTAFVAALMEGAFGVSVFKVYHPALLLLGLVLLTLQAVSYGVIIASISMRTSIPHGFIDVLSIVALGLIMAPLDRLPHYARYLLLVAPYVAPAYLVKLGIRQSLTPLLFPALAWGVAISSVLVTAAVAAVESSERFVKVHGVKGVGFT